MRDKEFEKMNIAIIRENLELMRDAIRDDLLPSMKTSIQKYENYPEIPIPADIKRGIEESLRDMKIIISRIDYFLTNVFIENDETLDKTNWFIKWLDFYKDYQEKNKSFDNLYNQLVKITNDQKREL